MPKGYFKYTVWRRISNNHENIANIISTSADAYKDLMEENGIYDASGVLFKGRKLYLRCIGCIVELWIFEMYIECS